MCLLAARRALMQAWIHPTPPQIAPVKQMLQALCLMEKLDTNTQNFKYLKCCIARWRHYMERSFSPEEISLHMKSFHFSDWYLRADLANSLGKLRIQDTSHSVPPP